MDIKYTLAARYIFRLTFEEFSDAGKFPFISNFRALVEHEKKNPKFNYTFIICDKKNTRKITKSTTIRAQNECVEKIFEGHNLRCDIHKEKKKLELRAGILK